MNFGFKKAPFTYLYRSFKYLQDGGRTMSADTFYIFHPIVWTP
ncbi:MAG: hypothetical protein ABIO88_13940 [Burkholderiaceae bacterium]